MKLRYLTLQGIHQQVHQQGNFLFRAPPVFTAESEQCQGLDVSFCTILYYIPYRFHAPLAPAVAAEQEMKARVQEMKAKVIEAEAQVPLAMAEAFRKGNLGVMDYYHLKNIEADTEMRDSISKMGGEKPQHPSGHPKPKEEKES